MGEAKRRKASGTFPKLDGMGLPEDIKADIATSVRMVPLPLAPGGGTCVLRTLMGLEILKALNFEPRLTLGAMLFRAGPHPMRDVVGFCGAGNRGQVVGAAGMMGHAWIEMGGDLIDFSAGDWVQQVEGAIEMGRLYGDPDEAGPVQFDVLPPDYLWAPASPLKAGWRSTGEPSLGGYWYGPFEEYAVMPDLFGMVGRHWLQVGAPLALRKASDLDLTSRVADWHKTR